MNEKKTVGKPHRSEVFHTGECRHIKRAKTRGYKIQPVSEAAIDHHDLEECPSCRGEQTIHNRAEVTSDDA